MHSHGAGAVALTTSANGRVPRGHCHFRTPNHVQTHQEIDSLWPSHADAGDRRNRPPGRRRGTGQPRRHRRAGHRRRRQVGQAGPGLLPADRRLPGKDLRGRQDPRRLFQARRAPVRKGNADVAAHRPPDPAAVPGRLLQRNPGDRDGDVGRSGDRSRHPGDDRRVRRAVAVGRAVQRADRRRARRLHRRPVRAQSDQDRARRRRN